MHDWQNIAEQHGPLVWNVAYRVLQNRNDAADCHQEVFVDAMGRTAGKTIDNWAAFLRWLTVQRAIDRLRSRNRQYQRICAEQPVDELPIASSAGNEVEWNELIEIVRQKLTRIPVAQAQVFWLNCVEDVDLADIAEQLNITANHARVLLHRSRVRLRTALSQSHPSLVERQK